MKAASRSAVSPSITSCTTNVFKVASAGATPALAIFTSTSCRMCSALLHAFSMVVNWKASATRRSASLSSRAHAASAPVDVQLDKPGRSEEDLLRGP